MITKQVEYGRTVNLGNYENFRLRVSIELEEGDTFEEGMTSAYNQVHQEIAVIKAADKAAYDAEHKRDAPFEVTPDMVADVPTLREKAKKAASLAIQKRNEDTTAEASKKALEQFGVEVEFTQRLDGTAIGQIENLVLYYQHHEFTFYVLGERGERLHAWSYVRNLETLGKKLAALDGGDPEREDLPF